jgi:hypothetical protein
MNRAYGSYRMSNTRLMLAQLRNEIRPQFRVVEPRKSRRGLRVEEIDISSLGACLLSQKKPMVGTDIVSIKRTVSLGDALAELSLRGIIVAIAFPTRSLTLQTFRFRLIAFDVPESRQSVSALYSGYWSGYALAGNAAISRPRPRNPSVRHTGIFTLAGEQSGEDKSEENDQ